MRMYIDCEFNGFGGHLISMAIVTENGKEFYVSIDPYRSSLCDFVKEHVVPVIDVPGASPKRVALEDLPFELFEFLSDFNHIHLVADWPDDIKYFCESLITAPGERISTPEIIMQIVREDGDSEVPHNALYDARALKEVYNEVYTL